MYSAVDLLWLVILVNTTFMISQGEHATGILTSHAIDDAVSPTTAIFMAPITSAEPTSLTFTTTNVPVTTTWRVSGMAFDPVDQKVYAVQDGEDLVVRSDLDGGNPELIDDAVTDPKRVCLDIYNRRIFWNIRNDAAFNAMMTRPMDLGVPPSQVSRSRDIAPNLNYCSYGPITQSLYLSYQGSPGSIQRLPVPVDGTSAPFPEVLAADVGTPVTVVVDEAAGELFYGTIDGGDDTIIRIDLNTGASSTVFQGRTSGVRAMIIYHDLLYVADTDDDTNQIYTLPRTASGLSDGDETELTCTYPTNAGNKILNLAIITTCCTACVSNVAVTVDSANELSVTWDAPIVSVCDADYYTITAVPTNIDQCSAVSSDSDTMTIDWQTQNSVQLTDLLPNTDYDITVTPGLTDLTNPSVINAGDLVVVSETTSAAAPSGAPGIVVTGATDNSVDLAFTESSCGSQNGEILAYSYYCSNGHLRTLGMTTTLYAPTATVTGLLCDTEFTCYAAAVNDIGTGPYAEVKVDGSISTVPTSKPCNLQITQASSSDITFAWEKCVCGTRGGVTQSYTYRLLSNGQTTTTGETNDLSMTFNIPVCDEEHIFEVAVTTSAGTGPYVQMDFRGNAGLSAEPQIVSSIISFDAVVIEIMEKPCVLDELPVLFYVYTLKRLERQTQVIMSGEVEAEDDLLTTIEISPLECDTCYHLSIAATNALGIGPETIFTFVTDTSPNPFLPGASLVVVPVSSSTTQVSWESSSSACPSTEFVVQYRLVNLEQCEVQLVETWTRISTLENEITLHNLNGGSTYSISVTSQTSSDVDVALQATWTTPESAPQVPPTHINVVRYNQFDLAIEWRAPPCGTRGGIISYEYELVALSDQSQRIVNSVTTTDQIIQISPPFGYVSYLFRVAAFNSIGDVYSESINIIPEIDTTPAPNTRGLCADGYCLNGGTCFPDLDNADSFCRCQSGYNGRRCGRSVADDGVIIAVTLVAALIAVTATGILACLCVRRRRRLQLAQSKLYQPPMNVNQGFQSDYFEPQRFSSMQLVN